MTISSINGVAYTAYAKTTEQTASKKPAAAEEKQVSNVINEPELDEVTFEKSDEPVKTGYEKTNKLTKAQISRLESLREESLRNMVTQLLSLQASGGKKTSVATLDVSELLSSEQTAAPTEVETESEDFYSVNAVATRIMDMAISLSGGDTSKIETLKNAVIKGFEEAGAALECELPDICNKTYDEIMKRFDYWTNNGSLNGYVYEAAENE